MAPVAVLATLLLGAPAAGAATAATWVGSGPAARSPIGDWSQGANWTSGSVPTVGDTLVFPRLDGCSSSTQACYVSYASSSLTASSISIGDDLPYSLSASHGTTLTLDPAAGQDGLDSATSGPPLGSPYVAVPLVLGDSQHWSVVGNGSGVGDLAIGSVTPASLSAPQSLAVTLSGGAQLFFDVTVATGGLTLTGAGSSTPAENGLVGISRDANTGSGDGPIVVQNAALLLGDYASLPVSTGSVAVQSGALTVGAGGPKGPGSVRVLGTLGIDAGSTTTFELEDTNTTPGSGYADVLTRGDVTLGGQLVLSDESAPSGTCPTATLGSVETFIHSAGGTVTGQFANLPNDAITSIAVHCDGGTLRYPIQLHYTPVAVSGTFVHPTRTQTVVTAAPRRGLVRRNVTFTATVKPLGPGAGAPTGAVQFRAGGRPIRCSTGGLLPGSSPAVATCTTAGLRAGTHRITAVYGGDGAWDRSSSKATRVVVTHQPGSRPHRRPRRVRAHTVRDGALRATVSCPRGHGRCRVRLSLIVPRTHAHHRPLVLGATRMTIAPGRHHTKTVPIDASGRRTLAHRHVVRAKLILRRRVRGRLRAFGSQTVTLRAHRHR